MSAERNYVTCNDDVRVECDEPNHPVNTQCECCDSQCNLPRRSVEFSENQAIEHDDHHMNAIRVKYNDMVAERNFVTFNDNFRTQCNIDMPSVVITGSDHCNNAERDCRDVLPFGKDECKIFNQNVTKKSIDNQDVYTENSLNWTSRLHREDSLKCLNTECCGNSNFVAANDMSLSSGNTNSLIFNESPNINKPDDLKCWCNKDDCRMYLDNNYCSDYYVENSDVTFYENIRFKHKDITPTDKNDYVAVNMNVKNECNMYKNNNVSNYAEECSDTDTTTSEASDESMTSLDSGIKTVIYESVSSKDVNSLPHDEDVINKNERTKPHSKSACVLS